MCHCQLRKVRPCLNRIVNCVYVRLSSCLVHIGRRLFDHGQLELHLRVDLVIALVSFIVRLKLFIARPRRGRRVQRKRNIDVGNLHALSLLREGVFYLRFRHMGCLENPFL